MQKYNGQLIRQFASSVSGNAASGVTITVRRQSDSGLATLYVDNNIAGATLSNPITSSTTGHFSFYAEDGLYTLTFSDTTPQQVIQLQDLVGLQTQFENAVLNAGYIPSGTFSAGGTLTQANQVLSDGSAFWRWDGALPKTVTAGSAPTPTGVGNWVLISDGGLRGDLAAADSAVLIGGVTASSQPATFQTVAAMIGGINSAFVGRKVNWLGYYAVSDGGSGWGIVKSGAHTHDGGKIISVNPTLYIEQNIKGFNLSVKKYGVRGDGVTNDTTQFQRCLNSGEPSVFVPKGIYILNPLIIPDWITLEGVGYQPSVGGGTRISELRFSITTGESAMTCGSNPTIRKLFIINVGGTYNEVTKTLSGTAAAAIKLNENAVIEECGFWLWYDCIKTGVSTFYLRTSKLHFNRCTFGYTSEGTSPYDMHIDAPHSALTEVFIRGVGDNTPRNIKVFGGSIEGYSTIAQRFLDIAFFGTYFESEPERTVSAAIDPQLDESTVSLFGCTVFMNKTTRFVNMSGLARVGLTSSGNTFAGDAQVGATCFYLPNSGSVSLAGDKIESSIMTNTLYIDSISQGLKLGGIRMPLLQAGNPQVDYSELSMTGARGAIGSTLSAAPTNKVSGQMILADGSAWDPLALAAGRPYYVIWQGDRWRGVSG
jgi:hypothetical protein